MKRAPTSAPEWSINSGHGRPEDGEIVRVSDLYVFVLFVGDRTPKATPPGALTLLLAPHQNESLF